MDDPGDKPATPCPGTIRPQTHGPKASQVTPAAATPRSDASLGRKFTATPRRLLGASVAATIDVNRAFRGFGLPMLAILVVCIAWTTFLILLTLKPNETANLLMGTGDFDDGQFRLIVEADPNLVAASTAALLVVDVCFLHVLVKMTLWRRATASTNRGVMLKARVLEWVLCAGQRLVPQPRRHVVAAWYDHVSAFWHELTSISGRNRKFWVRYALTLWMQPSRL